MDSVCPAHNFTQIFQSPVTDDLLASLTELSHSSVLAGASSSNDRDNRSMHKDAIRQDMRGRHHRSDTIDNILSVLSQSDTDDEEQMSGKDIEGELNSSADIKKRSQISPPSAKKTNGSESVPSSSSKAKVVSAIQKEDSSGSIGDLSVEDLLSTINTLSHRLSEAPEPDESVFEESAVESAVQASLHSELLEDGTSVIVASRVAETKVLDSEIAQQTSPMTFNSTSSASEDSDLSPHISPCHADEAELAQNVVSVTAEQEEVDKTEEEEKEDFANEEPKCPIKARRSVSADPIATDTEEMAKEEWHEVMAHLHSAAHEMSGPPSLPDTADSSASSSPSRESDLQTEGCSSGEDESGLAAIEHQDEHANDNSASVSFEPAYRKLT